MNSVFGVICWLSVAGSLLALLLLIIRRAYGHKLPPACFYYLWLLVLLRLLLPLNSPLPAAELNIPLMAQQPVAFFAAEPYETPAVTAAPELAPLPADNAAPAPTAPSSGTRTSIMEILPALWLSIAVLLMLYSLISYGLFRRALRKNSQKICEPEILRHYQHSGEVLELKKLPALWVNDSIPTPMQVGLFSPVLLLPQSIVSQQYADLHYFLLHELVHYRRRDVLYKWLIQLGACLHWFNPLVYVMKRELRALCELSCDAKVLQTLGAEQRADYGHMLLASIETAVMHRPARLYGASWGTEVKTMKARLKHVVSYEKQRKPLWLLMAALTMLMAACTAISGPAKTPVPTAPALKLSAGSSSAGELIMPSITLASAKGSAEENYLERMLFFSIGEPELKVTYDGHTWKPYNAALENDAWRWWGYEEYEKYANALLKQYLADRSVTQAQLDEETARHVQTLKDIKNGIKVSKFKQIFALDPGPQFNSIAAFDYRITYEGPILWYCFGYSFKDAAGNDVDLGLFETRDQLFAALQQYYHQEVAAGALAQSEAESLYNAVAHSVREEDEVPLREKMINYQTYQREMTWINGVNSSM